MATKRSNKNKMKLSETHMRQTIFKYLVVDATGKRKLHWKFKMANP
jgi:hypothetical protein